jgi:hypothetical protein
MRKAFVLLLVLSMLAFENKNIFAFKNDDNKQVYYEYKEGRDIDGNYVFALNTVDRFLHAWLMRDYKKGVKYISGALKKSVSKEELKLFFSGRSNPRHAAYEVVGWKYINDDTIRFNVWLYEYIAGESFNPIKHPEPFYIEVIRVEDEKWFINTLPNREEEYNGADNI